MSDKQLKFKGNINGYIVQTMVMHRARPAPAEVLLFSNFYLNPGDLYEFMTNQVEVTTDYKNWVLKITIDAYDPPYVFEVREDRGVKILTRVEPKNDKENNDDWKLDWKKVDID